MKAKPTRAELAQALRDVALEKRASGRWSSSIKRQPPVIEAANRAIRLFHAADRWPMIPTPLPESILDAIRGQRVDGQEPPTHELQRTPPKDQAEQREMLLVDMGFDALRRLLTSSRNRPSGKDFQYIIEELDCISVDPVVQIPQGA
jgi:hypothetical protein